MEQFIENFIKTEKLQVEEELTKYVVDKKVLLRLLENDRAEQLILHNVVRSFSLQDVEKITNDAMNLGMDLRQNQLDGSCDNSGNEVLKEYLDKL
jgi:hypothetical protein